MLGEKNPKILSKKANPPHPKKKKKKTQFYSLLVFFDNKIQNLFSSFLCMIT